MGLVKVYIFDCDQAIGINACLFPNLSYSILKNCFKRAMPLTCTNQVLFTALRKPPVSLFGSNKQHLLLEKYLFRMYD